MMGDREGVTHHSKLTISIYDILSKNEMKDLDKKIYSFKSIIEEVVKWPEKVYMYIFLNSKNLKN